MSGSDDATEDTAQGEARNRGADGVVPKILVLTIALVVAGVAVYVILMSANRITKNAPPQMGITADYDPEENTLLITHRGGDRVRVKRIHFLVVSSKNGDSKRSRLPVGGSRERPGVLDTGDTVLLANIDPGDEVRVVWDSPVDTRASSDQVISRYTVTGGGNSSE